MKKYVKKVAWVLVIVLVTFVATIAGEFYLLVSDTNAANQDNYHQQKVVKQWRA
jgi:flagellar basal body-associated protein FliL